MDTTTGMITIIVVVTAISLLSLNVILTLIPVVASTMMH